MGNWFYGLYGFIQKNRGWSLFAFTTLVAFLAFLAFKIQFQEDISKLIPTNDRSSRVQQVLKSVNFTDKIIVHITQKPQGSVDDLTQYAVQFLDSLNHGSSKYIKDIQGKVSDTTIGSTLDFIYNNLPLFLDRSDYGQIAQKLQKDSIEKIINTNYKTLISPSGIVARNTILKDPLGLSFIALKNLRQLGLGHQFSLHNGFLVSKDQKDLLLFITPTYGSSETAENTKFAENLYAVQEGLNGLFLNKVQSEYFGAALIAVANAQQIKRDIQFTVGIALTLLLLVFIFYYKKLTVPLILFAPTAFGGLLSIALLYLVRTEVSAISLGIGSVLLGVTLDYSLHILTHIRNNESTKQLYQTVTQPLLMSSLTTALAFLCLLFLESRALQDLGLFAALSVLGASIFALIFVPLAYRNRSGEKSGKTILDKIAQYDFHKNKWCIGVLCLLLVISAFTYHKVAFDKDISKLNYEPTAIKEAQRRLDVLTNVASKSIYLATYGDTPEEVLQINDTLYQDLEQLKKDGGIIDFSSIGSLVHSKRRQQQRISQWHHFWDPETIDLTKNELIANGTRLGFKPSAFSSFYSFLENRAFHPLQIADYKEIGFQAISDYINTKSGLTTITSLVKVDSTQTQKIREVFKGHKNTLVIDRQEMNETFLGNLKNDFGHLIWYSVLVVLLILFMFYRSLSLTLVTIVPIFLTWVLTLGIMGLFHIEFNIFNIIVCTFIFGLGIDYSIFVTNGLLETYRTGVKTLQIHRASILLSVITTLLGVGVLIFAKHPALHSISLVSIIGILSAMGIAFTLQPLLFHLFIGSSKKRPISLRVLINSAISLGYYSLGCIIFGLFAVFILPLIPIGKKIKMGWFHRGASKFLKSVLYSNPFVAKKVINEVGEDFSDSAIIIANHTSSLDSLTIAMLHPNIIFLVNDWVFHSPIFGNAVRAAGFYPVSQGVENSFPHLRKKLDQGYSLMAFPEGTRSYTSKINRFHKGAFYIADQLDIDIVPVLIHGNSDVMSKGSMVIRDGGITVKILERISTTDKSFGASSRQRTKNISIHFKGEFDDFRKELEGPTYFHPAVLDDFRYKGDALYKAVSQDLKENKETYHIILNTVGRKRTIIHLSEDQGQLDFLLLLDSADRKLYTYLEEETIRPIVQNGYIAHKYGRPVLAKTVEEAMAHSAQVLIINLKNFDLEILKRKFRDEITTLILLKESRFAPRDRMRSQGFIETFKNGALVILKRKS
ncbi:MMPL family transporter [Flavobacteriaceae bacterium F89]|uniref:MMPL family transporter n=1 Tax=Cerina litoralis TaxID=2874477 RepID=A0AAE3EU51_9FLAO|nr:1-acyl-sn-glycerol-3-phosphate acyltransferase [Cerina litoralis]MCG2460164.1 MMPL family transporter [Cerina litoralis]